MRDNKSESVALVFSAVRACVEHQALQETHRVCVRMSCSVSTN